MDTKNDDIRRFFSIRQAAHTCGISCSSGWDLVWRKSNPIMKAWGNADKLFAALEPKLSVLEQQTAEMQVPEKAPEDAVRFLYDRKVVQYGLLSYHIKNPHKHCVHQHLWG